MKGSSVVVPVATSVLKGVSSKLTPDVYGIQNEQRIKAAELEQRRNDMLLNAMSNMRGPVSTIATLIGLGNVKSANFHNLSEQGIKYAPNRTIREAGHDWIVGEGGNKLVTPFSFE